MARWGWREGALAIRFHPELPELTPVRSAALQQRKPQGWEAAAMWGWAQEGGQSPPGPSARGGLHKPALELSLASLKPSRLMEMLASFSAGKFPLANS